MKDIINTACSDDNELVIHYLPFNKHAYISYIVELRTKTSKIIWLMVEALIVPPPHGHSHRNKLRPTNDAEPKNHSN